MLTQRGIKMHGISAGIAACVVAAVTVGCGSAQAPAGHPATKPGAPTTGPSAGAPSGCPSPAPAGPAGQALTITLAGNQKTYCVRVGDTLRVDLRGTGSSRWLPPLASSGAVVPVPAATPAPAPGVTSASFAAMRPGQVVVTSVRPPCQVAIPPAKGDLEPGFAVPKAYPLRFCAPARRFSVSITVLR
jgi:hypothetical protein